MNLVSAVRDSYSAAYSGYGNAASTQRSSTTEQQASSSEADSSASTATSAAKDKVSSAEQAEIQKLQAEDRAVRQHEQAHLAAAGGLATSGASYTMTTGPDGKQYATGGEVSIDVSEGKTPEETVRKAQTIVAAALAPADPSSTDRAVAAQARMMGINAQMQIAYGSLGSQKSSAADQSRETQTSNAISEWA